MKTLKSHLQKELLRLEVSKADYLLDSIRINKVVPIDDPIPLEEKLSQIWKDSFLASFLSNLSDLENNGMLLIAFSLAYESLRNYDRSIEPKQLTLLIENSLKETVSLLDRPYTIQWALENEDNVNAIVEDMYELGREVALKDAESDTELENDERDNNAIAQLVAAGVIYSSVSTESQIILPIATRLVREGLISEVETTAMVGIFAEGLRELIPLKSDIYYQNLSSVIIGRARNYSRIFTYQNIGATYVASIPVGDDATCERCLALAGVYRVDDIASGYEKAMEVSTLEDLVDTSPFVNSIDAETNEFVLANGNRLSTTSDSEILASAGISIPYHIRCRCEYQIWTM